MALIHREFNTHISGWGSDGDNHRATLTEALAVRRSLIDERSISEKKITIWKEVRFRFFGWYVELSKEISL